MTLLILIGFIEGMHDSNLAAESRYFEVYILPLLKVKNKRPRNIRYFFQQGWLGWRHSVQAKDLKSTKFIEELCEELYKEHEQEFLVVATSILEGVDDTGLRTQEAEDIHFEALKGKEIESIFAAQLSLYKTFFESDFRLFGTIPYFYLCKKYGRTHSVTDPTKFVDVSGGEKFQALKNTTIALLGGNFPDLVSGFNNQIRNAGAGHDRWEVTDNSTMVLKVVDEKSGREKNRFEFSQRQFRDILQQCRINLWVLRNGFLIFLENNPEVEDKVVSTRVHKIREIREALVGYAHNRSFELKDFKLDKERTNLELSIKYNPPIVGRNEQIFFGSAEAYDIVHREVVSKYEHQMLDIIKFALLHLDKENLPTVKVHMLGGKDEDLGIVEYEKTELAKLLIEEGEVQVPVPSKGTIPQIECKLDLPIRVPYGQGAVFEELLKKQEESKRKPKDEDSVST